MLLTLTACDPSAFNELVGKPERRQRDAATEASPIREPPDASVPQDSAPVPDADASTDADAMLDSGGPAVDAATPACKQASDPASVRVSATELGSFTIASVKRTIIDSARMGARLLWLANTPQQSALWTAMDGLLARLPALPGPVPGASLLPINAAPADWTTIVGSLVPLNDREALIYFASNSGFLLGDAGLAHIAIERAEAQLIHPAGELFPPRANAPWAPVFYNAGLLHEEPDGSYIYVYGCGANPDLPSEDKGGLDEAPCRLARVRLTQAQEGDSYLYWSGESWVDDVSRAAVAIDHVQSGLSVSYNLYLHKFLAVHNDIMGNQIALRWADRPEGPWHPLKQIETLPAVGFPGTTFGAREHPALRDACQSELYITYDLPQTMNDMDGNSTLSFETRLVRANLY